MLLDSPVGGPCLFTRKAAGSIPILVQFLWSDIRPGHLSNSSGYQRCNRSIYGHSPTLSEVMLVAESQLGMAFNTRYNLTGNVESLDDCIAAQRDCIQLLPSFDSGDVDHQLCHSNLSVSLGSRYLITKHPDDVCGIPSSMRSLQLH
jgi:hypothetical protein